MLRDPAFVSSYTLIIRLSLKVRKVDLCDSLRYPVVITECRSVKVIISRYTFLLDLHKIKLYVS